MSLERGPDQLCVPQIQYAKPFFPRGLKYVNEGKDQGLTSIRPVSSLKEFRRGLFGAARKSGHRPRDSRSGVS